jgi:rhodanese-related sulfurtransferase
MYNKKMSIIVTVLTGCLLMAAPVFAHHPDTTAIDSGKLNSMFDSEELVILDVRMHSDYSKSKSQIKGAQRTSMKKLKNWVATIPKGNTVVVYCNSKDYSHSTSMAFKLQNMGLKHVFYLEGGWEGWQDAGYPIEDK